MILGMSISTIVTQILALICNAYIAYAKKPKHIHITNILYNIFCILTGLIQGTYSMCTSSAIIIYRSTLLIFKDKLKIVFKCFPLTFIILHIITGSITYIGPWDILSIIAPIITGCALWYSDDLQVIRWSNVITNIMWTVYNIYVSTYILAFVSLYATIINISAIIVNYKKEKE